MKKVLAKLTPAPRQLVTNENGVAVARKSLDPTISTAGHALLALLYIIALTAYTVYVLVFFFTAPNQQTFLQLPASNFAAVPLTIAAQCSNAPFCGDMVITANYTGLACAAFNSPSVNYGNSTPVTALPIATCYVQPELFSVQTTGMLKVQGTQVDFSSIDPGLTVPSQLAAASIQVTAPSVDGAFNRVVNLDTWQVKTLLIGQNIHRTDDKVTRRTLYPMGVQYEGRRPNRRATLFISLSPLVNVYDSSAATTIYETIASIGGAASIISAALLILVPVARLIFKGDGVDETPDAAEEKTPPHENGPEPMQG